MTGKEFREIRESLGMSQHALSLATGINITQISRIENGTSPVRDYQEKLLLSLDKNNTNAIESTTKSHKNTIQIPFYDVYASAGSGLINNEQISQSVGIDKDFLRSHFGLTSFLDLSIITARGDSMSPTIPENAQLLVQKLNPSDGQICVVRIDDELYVKRLQKLPRYRLLSDNEKYESIELEGRDYEIVGVVMGLFKRVG